MKKEQIKLSDWQRILFGDAPPEFMIEVFIRTLIIYLALLFVVRWLGKRMSGQLTITEMAVMITLGAIVSVPMQIPDRGILQGLLVLVCALLFHRGINLLGFKSQKWEKITQGELSVLVKDGIIQLDELEKTRISRQQLFAELRGQKIFQLGKVKRVYLEGCGIFSVFTAKESRPGLPVLPDSDLEIVDAQPQTTQAVCACISCGNVSGPIKQGTPCAVCGNTEWTKAVN